MTEKQLVKLVHDVVELSQKLSLIKLRDKIYYTNKLYTLLNITPCEYIAESKFDGKYKLHKLVSQIYDLLSEGVQSQLGLTREQAETRIVDEVLPAPSIIECIFNTIKTNKSIKDALDWYYQFSKHTDYIKVDAIAKNQKWTSNTKYGNLEITINLSKPEKDPKEIAKAKSIVSSNFPKCLLCIENEGHQGNGSNQPARHNHRMITLDLATEKYYFQYSPYLYYDEHSIIINPKHKDMVVDRALFENFFTFTDLMPHYLIGSNTDIPIVGGSILTHDHYQAGNYVFPIEKAATKFTFELNGFDDVLVEYLNWPVSTLKLTGGKTQLLSLSLSLLDRWYKYSNEDLDIIAETNGQRYNAITPIMRKIYDDKYVVYLLLRNNRTSNEYPDGIFHPHAELHHIKKENIGLIEAMGLAILPGRLAKELTMIKNVLLSHGADVPDDLIKHKEWVNELKAKYLDMDKHRIDTMIESEVANKFALVLEHAGVFKQNSQGNDGIKHFISLSF